MLVLERQAVAGERVVGDGLVLHAAGETMARAGFVDAEDADGMELGREMLEPVLLGAEFPVERVAHRQARSLVNAGHLGDRVAESVGGDIVQVIKGVGGQFTERDQDRPAMIGGKRFLEPATGGG